MMFNLISTEKNMKKIIIAAFAACALLAACTEKESAPVQNNDIKVVFEIGDKAGFGQDTKAVKTAWAEGDQILVIFKANNGVNQGQGFLTDDCEVNTLRFVYDGSAWKLKDNNISDLLQLGSSGLYFAFHHRVFGEDDIVFAGANCDLTNYNGGELLQYQGSYAVSDGILTLETVKMEMALYGDQFQISVPDLPSGKNWKMYICNNNMVDGAYPPANLSKEGGIEEGDIFFNDSYYQLGNYSGHYSPGVKNGTDVSFVTRASSWSESDEEYQQYSSYKFLVTDGTKENSYVYVKSRGIWDGGHIDFAFTLEGGHAYRLPSFNNKEKWIQISPSF